MKLLRRLRWWPRLSWHRTWRRRRNNFREFDNAEDAIRWLFDD